VKALSYLAIAGYLIVWLFLLIDCIRRKRFYPVFGNQQGTKFFWLVTFIFFNPLLTLLYLVFGRFAPPDARPSVARSAFVLVPTLIIVVILHLPWSHLGKKAIVMKRDPESGAIVSEGGRRSGVEIHAAITEAKDRMNSSSTSFSSDHTRLACRRLLLVNRSSHALMERAGMEIQKLLVQLPFIEQVVYLPAGQKMPEGGLAPDITVLLEMPRIKETRFPLYRGITATVLATAGSTPYQSGSHYSDQTTPPPLEFEWRANLSHRSNVRGYESAGAKYKLVANDIAGQIGKALSKQLTDWIEKYGLMPEMPDFLYGTYRKPPDMAFLPREAIECVQSCRALMRHNQTVWRFTENRDTSVVLASIKSQMESEGWKDRDSQTSGTELRLVRMKRDTERLVVFRQQRDGIEGEWITTRQNEPEAKMPVVVHYENLFSDEETEKAMRALLDSSAPVETVMLFDRFLTRGSLENRYFEMLEKCPLASVSGNITLAENYQRHGEKDKARQALLRAIALLRTEENHGNYDGRIKDLARRLEEEKLTAEPVPVGIYRDLGFIEQTSASATVEREVALGEPLVLYDKENPLRTLSIRIKRAVGADKKNGLFALHWIEAGRNDRSWGNRGGLVGGDGRWSASEVRRLGNGPVCNIRAESLAAKDRFRIRIEASH